MKAGIIGAGAISDIYLKNLLHRFDGVEVVSICANHMENAKKQADKYGIRAVTMEEMLADPDVEMVVNLTPASAHDAIIKAALLAGKHVYTEKTITDTPDKAAELLELADSRGLCLASAPDTFMGAALQTARKAVDDGLLGDIHSFVISANRDNTILLSLFSFLRQPGGGIVQDFGVYYITALVSLLGAVKRVGGIIGKPYPQHTGVVPQMPTFGKTMDTPNESQVSAVLQLENGITGTFHMDADCSMNNENIFAIYGTKGILSLPDPNDFGGAVKFIPSAADPGKAAGPVILKPVNEFTENSRGIGPADMAAAIQKGISPRPSKEMAYHVLEVLSGILAGGGSGRFVDIASRCERPQPLE